MDLGKRNENMREFFNRKIDTYDDVHSAFMDTKRQMVDAIKDEPEKVLDLGAGTGLELIHLYERFPNVRTTAIDITENMLSKLAKRPFASLVSIICEDFFKADFGTEYDYVISTSALHHFLYEDKKRLYKKIYDSLKVGGEFLNSDKVAATLEDEANEVERYNQKHNEVPHIDTPLCEENEVRILEEVGFKNIEVIDTTTDGYKLIRAKK